MWSLLRSPLHLSSQDKEPGEVTKQTNVGGRRISQCGVRYYQTRSRSEETSASIGETEGMYKRKVKPPGGAQRASGDQQQGDSAGLDDGWQVVQEEELQASQVSTPKEGKMEQGMTCLGAELMTLSTDSEAYRTPLSSLSEHDRGVHQGFVQLGFSDSDVILRLQEDSIAKDTTIRKLQQEVDQLQRRLKYTEQLEEQNLRLTTEERKHEQEKQLMKAEIQQLQRKASVSRPYTRGYVHEQKLQEMVNQYERQYNEQLEENSRLQEKISQLEKGMCEDTVVAHIDDVGDSDLKVELKKKEQHIHTLQTQVESMQQHPKGQSREVLQLKQELEALKATGEEVDQSWREMVDQLEEENRKLSLDVGGLHQDKYFMEKSMEALKAQQEMKEEQFDSENRQLAEQIKKLSGFSDDLNTLANTLQTKIRMLEREKEALQNEIQIAKTEGELKKDDLTAAKDSVWDELERLQKSWSEKETALVATQHENVHQKKEIEKLSRKNAQLDSQLRQLQTKLHQEHSKAASSQATAQLDEVVKERNQLEQKTIAQQAKIENTIQELAQSRRDVTQLTTEVEQLRIEKADLVGEVEAHKLMLTEKDLLLQEAQDEQLQLRQQNDGIIQSLQGEKDMLRQQVSILGEQVQSQKAQPTHLSEFWEVPRRQVQLNMQKMLGTGAWGFVVEGTFRGQQVAVKCLHDMIRSPRFVEVMRKEIGIMAQVRHPNLVLLIAAVMDTENDPLIVTELLDISLRKGYEKKCLQSSSKLNIFQDIAAALNYLHLHHCGEIIHRDVSSANVLLEAKPNNQWKAKLSDFGSAKLAMEAKTTAPGAPVYSAPEVRKDMGIRQTSKMDVYSYGILLCEVTTEQFPDEESLPSMMQEVQGKWPFMHGLITSCIQDHPDRRPTMLHILSEFSKLQRQDESERFSFHDSPSPAH